MAHIRNRYIEAALKKALQFSGIVGILGQRQTGKTTLLSKYSKAYATLDIRSELETATLDPMGYLQDKKTPFAIDECQLCPPLFPALKEWNRLHPKRGQFLLSGSVRFTSRRQIKESLTGRITLLELLPLTLSECHSESAPDPTSVETYRHSPRHEMGDYQQFLSKGGLPGICFHRNQKQVAQGFDNQIIALLDRDLRLLVETKLPFTTLKNFLFELASMAGSKLDISHLSRVTRISRITIRRLIAAFESMFVIRILSSEGGVSTPTVLFEDIGMLNYLTQNRLPPNIQLLNTAFQCFRAPYFYSFEKNFRFFQYQTRGGAYVPLVLQLEGKTVGWIFTSLSEADQSTLKSANSFLKKYPDGHVFILGQKLNFHKLNSKITTGNWLSAF